MAGAGLAVIALVTLGLAKLEPAAPRLDKSAIYSGKVIRGPLVHEVRGNGTLVPEHIQLVQAETEGRVERILILPGSVVQTNSVILELSNPELEQSAFETEWQIKSTEAQITKMRVQLESERLSQESVAASLKTDVSMADVEFETEQALAKAGLVPQLELKRYETKAIQLRARYQIELERLNIMKESSDAQVAVLQADLAKTRALYQLKLRQISALKVQAGIDGVLQQIGDREPLRAGQRVRPSETLARVVMPTQLKAEIKIPETQARDVQIGQVARIDTRSGEAQNSVVSGKVARIDPAAQNGTVTVDVAIKDALPKGARPDMNVEGVIELERLTNVLNIARPIQGQPNSTIGLFKVSADGKHATRVPVKLGSGSVNSIVILNGLVEGDEVILSDMSQYDSHDRVRLN
jgi:HlyD family secretion protein